MESSIFIALIPVIFSLVLIVITRKTVLSLLLGALIGSFLVNRDSLLGVPGYIFDSVVQALGNPWHYSALVFTISLGGVAALLQAGRGLSRLFSGVKSRRQLEVRSIGLGLLCFFDGLANSLLIGRLVRPEADRVGMSREKLAYIADTTSSAIACLAPVSTWIAMQLGLINKVFNERELSGSPYSIFLKSIPVNFYCLFSLLLLIGITLKGRDFGPMKNTVSKKPEGEDAEAPKGDLLPALYTIVILLLSVPALYYLMEVEVILPFSF